MLAETHSVLLVRYADLIDLHLFENVRSLAAGTSLSVMSRVTALMQHLLEIFY